MHKIRYNTAPPKICSPFNVNNNINYNSRRDPEFFNIPGSRLKALDKTLSIKGPRLYNKVVNELNKEQTSSYVKRMFLNSFKNRVACYLKSSQEDGNIDWAEQNFPLYTV